jgi:heat shock protein HtpX
MNYFRTFMLMTVLTVLFVVIGGLAAGNTGAVIAFLIAAGINFYSYWFSDKAVLSRYSAQEAGPNDGPLYSIVERLSRRDGLPMPKVFVVPDPSPNAFATGRNPQHAAVAATAGILRLLTPEELEGVIAHELTHVRNRDMLIGTVAATMAGAITMLAQMAQFGGSNRSRRGNPIGVLLMVILGPLAAILIQMAISRSREYAADVGGAQLSGNPMGLAHALEKLARGVERVPIEAGRPSDSNIFIVNPFFGGLGSLFATHPPIEERVRRLREMAAHPMNQ